MSFVIFTMVFGTALYLIVKDEETSIGYSEGSEGIDKRQRNERVNILLLGIDSMDGSKERGVRTDTIMVLSLDPKENQASILSIPRDTRVRIRGRKGYDKVNHAHAYGGADLAISTVKDLLGISIHHYVRVDYQALFKTVDDVGGVEVDVPMNMKYTDTSASPPLYIDLKKGRQVLDGNKAMQFLRYRKGYPDQDLGRIRAQQQFMDALIKKVLSPASILRIPSYVETLHKYVDTDLKRTEMVSLALQASKINPNEIQKATIPGQPMMISGVSYYKVNDDELNKLVKELYNLGE
ncbi:LCP family protein [Alkalithermobacter paradoxus]|uniref:LCP family protein n=1 Tax=Alkalithermobacter paradoxus TaxID=29349 RepID=UPI002F919527